MIKMVQRLRLSFFSKITIFHGYDFWIFQKSNFWNSDFSFDKSPLIHIKTSLSVVPNPNLTKYFGFRNQNCNVAFWKSELCSKSAILYKIDFFTFWTWYSYKIGSKWLSPISKLIKTPKYWNWNGFEVCIIGLKNPTLYLMTLYTTFL